MTVELRWADPRPGERVITQSFTLDRRPATVPGVAWYAAKASASKTPLVLLGHGGGSHKASARNARLASRLVNDFNINAVAIDGPYHGERSLRADVDYQATMVSDGVEAVTDRVVDEWIDVLSVLRDHRFLAYASVGYLGFSMGSRFGVPLAARLGDRLDAAVLGKYGVQHSGLLHPGLSSSQHTLNAARRVSAPVLFHLERHDEVFLRGDQVTVFDALASRDKTLIVREGAHWTRRPDDETTWLDFLARHLIRGATPAPTETSAAC